MVFKFDEINEDNINDMSLEDLRESALSGKTELMSARGVIGDLNKKIKNPVAGENNVGVSKEELDNHYDERKQKEKFDNFLNENNLDDDQKKQAIDYFGKGLSPAEIAKLTGVTSFEQNQNNSNRMNIGAGESGSGTLFDGKLSHSDYKQLDKTGQEAYKSFSRGKFGGLSFDRGSINDD